MAASEAAQRWAVHVQRWRENGLTQVLATVVDTAH